MNNKKTDMRRRLIKSNRIKNMKTTIYNFYKGSNAKGSFGDDGVFNESNKSELSYSNIKNEKNKLEAYNKKSINNNIVLNGRDEQISILKNALIENSSIIIIKSDSLLESYTFLITFLYSQEGVGKEVRIIDNQITWEKAILNKKNLILIPGHDFIPDNIGSAINNEHNVVFYSGIENIFSIHFDKEVILNKMNRLDRISALEEILGDNTIATTVYNDTKGYFYQIIRHPQMGFNEQYIPKWVAQTDSNVLITIFLLSEWDELKNNAGKMEESSDIKLVELLSGKKYNEFNDELIKLSKQEDSPIRKISHTWQIISKSDMWVFIAGKISPTILEKFTQVCKEIFIDRDESYDLPKEQRWCASLHGKSTTYSKRIRAGVSDSFLLVSVLGADELQTPLQQILRNTLNSEVNASKLLNSLGSNIENLAEAYPEIFLDYIEQHIDSLNMVFDSSDSMFAGSGAYTNLLWALEKISLHEEYAVRVIDILFELAHKYDNNIPDNHSNRPLGTLNEVFIPWLRHTPLDITQRLTVLKRCSSRYQDETFELFIKLLNTQTSMNIALPRYQNWYQNFSSKITNGEYNMYLVGIIDLFIDLFSKDIENKVIEIMRSYTKFKPEQVRRVIDILKNHKFSNKSYEKLVPDILNEIEQDIYGSKVYGHTSVITNHPELESEIIELYNIIENKDLVLSSISLFSDERKVLLNKINEYSSGEGHWDDERQISNTERCKRIQEIYQEKGFEGILELNSFIQNNYLIANSIVESGLIQKILEDVLELLELEEKNYLGMNIISQIFNTNIGKIDELIKNYSNKSDNFKVNFLLGLPVNKIALGLLKDSSDNVQEKYWKSFENFRHYRFLREDAYEEMNYVLSELNKYKLYGISYEQVNMGLHDKKDIELDINLVVEMLKGLIEFINSGKHVSSLEYHLKIIMKFLYDNYEKAKINSNDIFNIEMAYLKAIDNPKMINEELGKNPKSFVSIINNVFKSKKKNEDKDLSTQDQRIVKNSYELISKFSMIPGTKEDGSIDKEKLYKWIRTTLKLLKESDRYEIGSQKIGEVLINCSNGKDGIHPCEEIRDLFEEFKNKDIEIGFDVGVFNSRGVTMRGVYDGGKQEWDLADKYEKEASIVSCNWPRTAKILRDRSKSYKHQAKRQDEDIELGK